MLARAELTRRCFYLRSATCCRPALLLRNGTQRLLRRCSAATACGSAEGGSQVSCGPVDEPGALQFVGRLVNGWSGVLREPGASLGLADAIPTGPARCCAVCLDTDTPALALPCEANNFCSGHGACGASGRCTCDRGWGGVACADAGANSTADALASQPLLLVAVLLVAVCLAGLAARAASLSAALDATRRAAHAMQLQRRAELEAPLLGASSSEEEGAWGEEEEEGSEAQQTEAQAGDQTPADYEPPAEGGEGGKASVSAAQQDQEEPQPQPRRNYIRNAPECNGVCGSPNAHSR